MTHSPQQIQHLAKEFHRRRLLRSSLTEWCKVALEREPALHHRVLIQALEDVEKGRCNRLIVMMPPGAAKSSYVSKAFPPHYLAQRPNQTVLACSYSYDFVQGFGRWCRNAIDLHQKDLGYSLAKDSKAAGEWETTTGGRYFCAGVNSGIAGHRADLGLIDDPIGSALEADSKLFRDRLWTWYHEDFVPRLKPGAARVIICNRRHEDDLVGRLLDTKRDPNEAAKWRVIKFTMEAKEGDMLGRPLGARLWPEWFTDAMLQEAKADAKTWAGLYQQDPTPESGDFFKRDWISTYQPEDLPKNLRIYVASDHAVSTERGANRTCFLPVGVDEDDTIWVLPDIYWKVSSPSETVEAMIDLVQRRRPVTWWAEKGHISKSLRPLIEKRMKERGVYFALQEVTPKRDKRARAGAIAGRMQMLKVKFPAFASWYADALFEMMSFTGNGDDKSDDFVDTLAHIGMGLQKMVSATPSAQPMDEIVPSSETLTFGWLKGSHERRERSNRIAAMDN